MSDIGIALKDRLEICKSLETVLAQTYALYLKTQNFHWNIAGPHFQELHLLFEDHYGRSFWIVSPSAELYITNLYQRSLETLIHGIEWLKGFRS